MESVSVERERPRLGPNEDAARKRAAVETYARNETALRKTARRYSLCEADADEALQRALEIALRKAPTADPRELVKWTQTVVKHEALAVREERERILAGPAAMRPARDAEDWVALLPSRSDGPAEQVERREAIARSREALQALKPQELRALTLLAEGYTYAEIGEITQWSQTKINRCLAEGRERFRSLVSRSEDGRRCAELRPLISAFCDNEAGPEEVAQLREHLRACSHCRATLRAYRAAPAAAGALAPALPLGRSLLERLHEAFSNFAARFQGGEAAVPQVTAGYGSGGAGIAALAKAAAVCVGSAAVCVAGGVVPAPLSLGGDEGRSPRLERQVDSPATATVTYDPAPEPAAPKPEPEAHPKRQRHPVAEPPAETEPVAAEPAAATAAEAIEYAPPPEPVETAPAESPSESSPAGEFGP
ncbi:MAG TPA: sigma-70 family RNA polymerase sigma factor [Solirubrobacterales bacterium]|nr:sigma-70 family RNA polymerase sigma factor [Solirubrobacterales bacterium]